MFGNANLFTIFTTGLLTGGLTCMAVQGGLLTATLAQREEEKLKEKVKQGQVIPILSFLIAKLVAYTILGFFLGWLGSLVQLSLQIRIILQLLVVVFMVGTALNMLKAHPLFRYFSFQPPHFLARLVRKQSKRKDFFAPAILGAFTVFIPCGTTQAMMALSIASGNPVAGAAILFAFVLGTSPLFFILGYMTMKLGDVLHKRFTYIAVASILLIALFNLDGTLALTGTQYTISNSLKLGFCVISYCNSDGTLRNNNQESTVDEQTIEINPKGYSPNHFAVKAGSKVTVHLVNKGATGCNQAFTIPALNVQKVVQPDTSGDITFTAPDKPGQIAFMCSMGMYPGTITVI